MPSKPIRIYLVRHGQSEANLDNAVNARLPDHRIALSAEGHRQAAATGEFVDLSELTSLKTFVTSFAGHIAAEASR